MSTQVNVSDSVMVVSIENPSEKDFEVLNAFSDAWAESMNAEVKVIQNTLGVSEFGALNVQYLRTRSRWTQELENKLIQIDKDGGEQASSNLNMCDFPSE